MIKTHKLATVMFLALVCLSLAANGTDNSTRSQLTTVNSSEILGKIEIGKPVEYDNVTVKGDLDLIGLNLSKENNKIIINSTVKITNSQIKAKIDFSRAIFNDSVDFSGSKLGFADFSGSQFNEYADFKRSLFKFAYFSGSQFEYADFDESQFGYADFIESQFGKYTNFSRSTFGSADFIGSQFNEYADFSGSEFSENTSFIRSKFGGNTFFRDSQFRKFVDFRGSQFEDADFSGSKFSGNITFVGSRFNGYVLGWSSIVNGFDEATYLALIRNLKDHGQFDDSNDCYYMYRLNKLIHEFDFYDFLSLISCGFGVRPEIPLFWSALLVPLFGIIFWGSGGIHRISCPFVPDQNQEQRSVSITEALYFSLLVFFHTHPPIYLHQSGRWRYLVAFEDILGWFYLAIFVVVLTNVIITK
ncbi:MAG: pentapeptide repeat-containing protein [Methanothrix sp.]